MSKIKSYDKNFYPSINSAINEILNEHLLMARDVSIYDAKALDEICFFLAQNDIQHEYIIIDAPIGAECDEVIYLVWMEPGAFGNKIWYSYGRAGQRTYRVILDVRADSLEEVEDLVSTWISDTEVDIMDWSVEDVVD